MFERFAAAARSAVTGAADEARARGDRRIGTDHLLIALLAQPAAAELLGMDAERARAAADRLDRAALAAIGVDVAGFRPAGRPAAGKKPAFGSGAREVMARTVGLATAERTRRIDVRHLLRALAERGRPDPAADLLAEMGVDAAELRTRLAP